MPVLELTEVHKSFRTHLSIRRIQVLKDLTLAVEEGEIFGFIGTNGAGKTTTIKLALSFIFPDRGSVRLFGRDGSDVALRRRIGYLPENPYFYDYLTGEEFLDFHARLFGMDAAARRRRVRELLDRVGVGKRGDRQLRTYSKGMLQRIGLAQALVNDPDLVILDEPMSGLDPIGRRDVRDIILELKARGKTVFFSTHILSDTEMICDRVGILVRGTLKALGTIDGLLSGEVPFWEVTLSGVGGDRLPCGRVMSRRRDRVLVRVDSQADVHRLLNALNGAASIVAVVPARRSLEDLFIREAGTASAAGAAPAGGGATAGGTGAADGSDAAPGARE